MYPDAIDFLDPYVKRYKIREFDGRQILEDKKSEILQKLLLTGKEIIISAEKSPRQCKSYKHPKIKWLYCIPKYPSNPKDHDFSNLNDFDGFSNHCQQMVVPLMSTILGSKIIEIHVTPDKSKNFIDNDVSFDFTELKQLIENIRICEKIKH
jgi:sialic acid synthase SpsE